MPSVCAVALCPHLMPWCRHGLRTGAYPGLCGGGCAHRRRRVIVAEASQSKVAELRLHKQHVLLSSVTCAEMVLSGQAPGEPHDGCMGSYRVLKLQKRQWQSVLQFDGNPMWVLDSADTATRCAAGI